MKKTIVVSSMALGCLSLAVGLVLAPKLNAAGGGSSKTAQSIMVSMTPNSTAFEIDGETTYTFNNNCAAGYYTNAWDGNPPTAVRINGNCPQPPAPTPPPPIPGRVNSHSAAEQCTFFCGGNLTSDTYTRDVVVQGAPGCNWRFTFTYNVAPTQASVDPLTCWTCSTTGGGAVDVKFCGFVAGESFLQKNGGGTGWDKKYSFTLTEPDPITGLPVSRVTNVQATLQQSTDMGTTWFDVQGPVALDTSNIVHCGRPTDSIGGTFCDGLGPVVDYIYDANAGFGGNVAAVGSYLHSSIAGHLAPDYTDNIMSGVSPSPDNFPNNNHDLCNYSDTVPFYVEFLGITEPGDYRVHVTGTVKGNSAIANQQFDITGGGTAVNPCEGDCEPPACNP